ncbi:MAG TPA: nucleotide-binding protein [Steroidobacteraceae bacterium]|jgi:hypothetical protein|nr:nucleotide-binding protein [Steroidobacteraceae bacterium]
MPLRVFIGSSTEALPAASAVADVLAKLNVEVVGWWDGGTFKYGNTIAQSLAEVASKCNAAILVMSPDDVTYKRGKETQSARDNLLFETGYFGATYGLTRAPIVKLGDVETPSDLLGIVVFEHSKVPNRPGWDEAAFSAEFQTKMRLWVNGIRAENEKAKAEFPQLPAVEAALRDALKRLRTYNEPTQGFDEMASSVLNQIADSFGDHGITEKLILDITSSSLTNAVSVFAVDVLGPKGWMQPAAYRYLAAQIRPYIRKNLRENKWHITVSSELKNAIDTAIRNAKVDLPESSTLFDNSEELRWEGGQPNLQIARILRWSDVELRSQMAATIIDIHEAFHVPLFYLPADASERRIDYILFKDGNNKKSGFWGAAPLFDTLRLEGPVPHVKDPWTHFQSQLLDKRLMFAKDARQILLSR